jgi:pimeloyl-ACP methyl ester carboxylesterase
MAEVLGVDIKFTEVILAGHSYGGATALATKAALNHKCKTTQYQPKLVINRVICLDPWLFPLEQHTYDNLQDQDIFMLNSQHFFEQVPYIYDLENLFVKLREKNPNLKAFMVKRMGHIASCDMVYVFGNILKFTGTIKLHHLTDEFMALNMLICQFFLEGRSKEEILSKANAFVRAKDMELSKVQVLEEYRVARHLTFGKDKPDDSEQATDIRKNI